ncbi:phage tail assembly protein [Streptomyces sp. NBC_00932]|uniref:phage tail assembly protein n=1 Tax=Streptomyces sp. NBC_00932 TaxID=2903690 RepID=UPI00386D35E2|nr:phage tail assembly protein [Streptomyces sp. NBC_00932]
MGDALSIKALRQEAEDKYPGLPLELDDGTVVTLRNLLRLDDTAQKNAQILVQSLQSAKGDTPSLDAPDELERQKRIIRDLFLLVADNPKAMKAELAQDGWDMAMLFIVIERWTELTQLPEASSSAS